MLLAFEQEFHHLKHHKLGVPLITFENVLFPDPFGTHNRMNFSHFVNSQDLNSLEILLFI